MSEIKCIVGLGNPGRDYENTRHNVGFMLLDSLVKKHGLPHFQLAPRWECAVTKWQGVFLVKPLTFMNLSGRSVAKIMKYYQWSPEQILVVYDDLSLDLGRLRIREKGSAGGHNGIKSLIEHLGTDEFPRMKMGIGAARVGETTDHVLGRFFDNETETLQNMLATAVNAVQDCLSQGVPQAANTYNSRTKTDNT